MSCNKTNQIQQSSVATTQSDSDSTKISPSLDKNEKLVMNLTNGFVIAAGDCEDFESFKTYYSILITRYGSVVYEDKEFVEYEFGDKLYPILLETGKNKFELLLEVNDRPLRNYLERLTILNDKVIRMDTLPTFISKPNDYDKDGVKEFAGYWAHIEPWGVNEELISYNPINFYELSKDGLALDSSLTITVNQKIYGGFYGYRFNVNMEMPIGVLKKFDEEIEKIKKTE